MRVLSAIWLSRDNTIIPRSVVVGLTSRGVEYRSDRGWQVCVFFFEGGQAMSVEVFTQLLPKCDVGPASLKWCPVWGRRVW